MKTKLFLFIAVIMTAFSINAQVNSIAVVGAGVGGWPGDPGNPGPIDVHQLTRVTPGGDDWKIENLVVIGPGIKLRANNEWKSVAQGGGGNWGRPASGSQWPTAIANEDAGSADIFTGVVPGTYTLFFNPVTKVYNFAGGAPIPVVKIVGTSLASPAGEVMTFLGADLYELTLNLAAGTVQFNVDGISSGSTAFPTGFATGSGLIPIATAKSYKVTYDNTNAGYTFVDGFVAKSIALVGTGTGFGFPPYTPPGPDPVVLKNVDNLNIDYRLSEVALSAGPVKFRENNAWTTTWAGAFPTATNTRGGAGDIAVTPAGTYSITLNTVTNTYNFFTPKVGIIGQAIGGWDTVNEIQMDTADGITYTKNNVVVVANVQGCKFRLDQNWDKSWGVSAFPSGTATTTSPDNVPATPGTFLVTFNRLSGEFSFGPPLSTATFAELGFKVFPNPTNNSWNFSSTKDAIVSIQIIDILGKVVVNTAATTIDASELTNGIYFAKVATATAASTVKVVKN